jgi:hypothetical protein
METSKRCLLDSILKFIDRDLNLLVPASFYRDTMKEKTMYHYLYISYPDTIAAPAWFGSFKYLGTDSVKAYQLEKQYADSGYHTMVYKTAGTSAAMLNSRLLMYPNEGFSHIVFHESIHNHLRQSKKKIPYEYEEALCDIVGVYGSELFYEKHKLKKTDFNEYKHALENIYAAFNTCAQKINNKKGNPQTAYKNCAYKIKQRFKAAVPYIDDRFNYKVNNAYLFRVKSYGANYFKIKKLYAKLKQDIKKTIEFMGNLPADLQDANKRMN